MTKNIQSLILLLIAIITVFLNRWQKDETPLDVVSEMMANCKYAAPGAFREGPFPSSIKWCEGVDIRELRVLLNHMEVHSKDMDASIAAEFGSYVKVGYLRSTSEFLINPFIVDRSGKIVNCYTSIDIGSVEKQFKSESIMVRYTDKDFNIQQKWFTNKDACLVQSMVEGM